MVHNLKGWRWLSNDEESEWLGKGKGFQERVLLNIPFFFKFLLATPLPFELSRFIIVRHQELYKKMSVFSTDQEFKSREEMMEWVQNTARDVGDVIVTKRSRTKPNGYSRVILMCERGGVYRSVKGTSKATGTKKINCPFELIGAYTKMNDCWKLVHIRDEHNHPPAQHMEGHAFVERLSRNDFQLVAELTKKHVAPRDILGTIKEQNGDNVSTLKTVYNARNKIRKINHKGKSPMQVVMSRLQENGYTYYTSINSISNELESLFFAHETSSDLLHAFPHVMLMDATYKTNKYNIPSLLIDFV
ncbi:uncharacterized protein LOC110876452 [Helianthus annuus]|uniref:uncharacterized protein LOC110876452 n=1 Tax=Helianthus annuus TaxID=4232 RepID=UPI000B8EF775|nr:uncharacterized protein LOC110876452 [Helianthus annuus]